MIYMTAIVLFYDVLVTILHINVVSHDFVNSFLSHLFGRREGWIFKRISKILLVSFIIRLAKPVFYV